MKQKKPMLIALVAVLVAMSSVLLMAPIHAHATEAADDAETAPISDEDMQRINDALPPRTTTTRRMRSTGLGSSGGFVVALDAGHGGNDSGAVGNGLQEKALNLRIALAAKAELESHGITVCMIRDSDTYVFSTNAALELQARVTKAYKAGASVYVSLHINSGGSSGAEVWYPRTDISYFPECGTQGQGLAAAILDSLTNGKPYGIARRGIFQRKNVEDTYPDGSLSDYYAVIRHAREYGFTGIIVEHGFIDNASDAYNLNRHAEAMGRADADAIMRYYGLTATWERSADGQHWMVKEHGSYVRSAWRYMGNAWYYLDGQGYMVTGWQTIGGVRYWFDASGAMATGWKAIGGSWYCFNGSGALLTGWQRLGSTWYYLDPSSGVMHTGWVRDGSAWYWLDDAGALFSGGWVRLGSTWYYFDGSGAMATGWVRVGGTWYYLDPASGAMTTGWAYLGGAWYWFDGSGAMYDDGWACIGGTWYWFQGSGAMFTGWLNAGGGTWYYLDASGALRTGWLWTDGAWYYLYDSGVMATGWVKVGGSWYLLSGSGAMLTGWQREGAREWELGPSGAWTGASR